MALEEGRQQGIERGIERGTLQAGREYLLAFLRTRFGEVPTSILELINSIDEPSVLQSLFTSAIAINSMEEFQQFLEQVTTGEISE